MNKNVLCGTFSLLKTHTKVTKLNHSIYYKLLLTNFDRATNPHPHPTDFSYEIRIRRMRILAGSITSLVTVSLAESNGRVLPGL